jgi:CubicO group peptidase (beta-lactamase class C family)
MVLVVVRGQDCVIQRYGETAKGNGQEPNSKSLLRIGSITKTFAGKLLAGLVVEGKMRLTDPLRMYAANIRGTSDATSKARYPSTRRCQEATSMRLQSMN